jgi:Rhs element Vgr protein
MSATAEIPNRSMHDVVTFDLVADGNALGSEFQIISISVSKEVNRIPIAVIVLRDGEAAQRQFAVSDREDFVPGKTMQINLGRDGQNGTVFTGMIVKHRVRVRENGVSELIVECRDQAVKMTIGRHSRYFEESKDSDAIEQLIREKGLTPDVEATSLTHKELVQYHCTDWDFVVARAEVNGRLVVVDDGKVQVKKPNTQNAPALQVTYGATLLEFEAEIDSRWQWKSVEAKAWDYTNQAMFEHSSDAAPVAEPGDISGATLAEGVNLEKLEFKHGGQVLEAELRQWTDAAMLKSRLAKICGRAKFIGFAAIKPGDVIDIQGVGNHFNGKAFVSAIRHAVGNGAWDTHVQFGLAPQWFHQSEQIMDTPAAGLLPAINGLQIGKVVQLQDDPDGEHRILVRLPIIDNEARGLWARVASLDAGAERGAFFRPEIDDEVIVGFVNDDPRDAVVLGMLHSSAKPAPIKAQDANDEKGIISRSKMRVHFNDKTKCLTIDTPAGNKLVLDEGNTMATLTDQNKNTVKLEPSGITLDSPGNITVKAGGKIDITATAAMTVSAAQLSLKAQGPAEMKGAMVTVEGSGITTIKGSMVMIN